jgi:transposase
VLDERFALILANAQQVRNVPGRKSDVNDATWIADLLAHGLMAASFVPPRPIRELRDLTRTRRQAAGEVVPASTGSTDPAGRQHQALLGAVRSDGGKRGSHAQGDHCRRERRGQDCRAGRSSRLECPRGHDPSAQRPRQRHHRYLLGWYLGQFEQLEGDIAELDARIEAQIAPFRVTIERVMGVPGVKETAAPAIIAEIGTQMSVFPSTGHLLSWARIVPRLDESAGKKRSRRVKKGGAWLKPVLVQCARAAVRKRGSYYGAQYRRLKARRGDRRPSPWRLDPHGHLPLCVTAPRTAIWAPTTWPRPRPTRRNRTRLAQRLRALGYHIASGAV